MKVNLTLLLSVCMLIFSCSSAKNDDIKPEPDPVNSIDTIGKNVELFGLTSEGGEFNGGAIFFVNGNGENFKVLDLSHKLRGQNHWGVLIWILVAIS